MLDRFRTATLLLGLILVLSACAGSQAQATPARSTAPATAVPTAVATSAPAPTSVPTLAQNVVVAGVDVGGLTPAAATQKLEQALAPLLAPIELHAGTASATLDPSAIGLQLSIDQLIEAAQAAQLGAAIDLQLSYDEARLRTVLGDLGRRLDDPPTITVITSTGTISRSFALSGGQSIDLDAAVRQIDQRLRTPGRPPSMTLDLVPAQAARPTPAQLQAQIEQIAKAWGSIAGVMVYDLASGTEIASLNKQTVFSAASTIKAAIMLNAYISLDTFTAKQDAAMKKMIIDSDNIAANAILAASAGGAGTEDALKGAEQMSARMAELGLSHTYLYVPFEAADYLAQKKLKYRLGPKRDGVAPFTDSGRALRTSPAEMARIYLYIDQCSRGAGPLLEQYPRLNAKRCQEMLDRFFANADRSRMRSGLARDVRVEHKSGWIDDMQADAGIVRTPGGDFVIAIYLFRPTKAGTPLPDKLFAPYLGGFTRLVYSYYNPVLLDQP
ncbi:MAG: serine hydrolase [Kouleothrix sp.]|jgi:beta-lactamase class A